MNRASRLAASALVLAAVSAAAAQERRPGAPPDPLLVSARSLSGDVAGDAPALAPHDRALLWARLGEVWWKDDEALARGLLLKAVEEVESAPEQEEKEARARRLGAARALLAVVGARDRMLGERLSAVLAAGARQGQATDKERAQNAEALANAALAAVGSDPRRAAELGAASLRAGVSYKFGFLLTKLYTKDAALAVSLFREGLAAARASRSDELLRVLAGEAFPHRLYFPPTRVPLFPEELRADTLRLLAENLLRPAASEGEEKAVCDFAWTAASLVAEFTALLPQQAPAARVVVNRCQQRMNPAERSYLEGEMTERKLETADEYLRAASDARDERMRNLYTGRAAYVAFSSGEPDRAIEIIEGMGPGLREEIKETWESWRWSFAAASALKHFEAGERQVVRRVLDDVPPKLRAFAVIEFLDQLDQKKPGDFPAELLGEARRLLTKYDGAEAGQRWWLTLVRLYAGHLPADGPRVFGEAVAALNRGQRPRQAGTSYEWPEYPWQPVEAPVPLVEADGPGVTASAASAEEPLTRARLRLGLLRALLEKRRAESSSPRGGRKAEKGAAPRPAP